MAFTSEILGRTYFGNKAITYGTYTTDTTGGDIDTGLGICDMICIQPGGGTTSTSAVNETLPVDGSAITIVVASGVDGYWWAIGTP